jgi:hypothetical protein
MLVEHDTDQTASATHDLLVRRIQPTPRRSPPSMGWSMSTWTSAACLIGWRPCRQMVTEGLFERRREIGRALLERLRSG